MKKMTSRQLRELPCALCRQKGLIKLQWLGVWTCCECVKTMLGFRQQLDDDATTALLLDVWR